MENTDLTHENDLLKKMLEQANAEKTALDQMFVEQLKSSLAYKKELILAQLEYKKLQDKFSEFSKKLEECEKEKLGD